MMLIRVTALQPVRFGILSPQQQAQLDDFRREYVPEEAEQTVVDRAIYANMGPEVLAKAIAQVCRPAKTDPVARETMRDYEWALAHRLNTMPIIDSLLEERMEALFDEPKGANLDYEIGKIREQSLQKSQILACLDALSKKIEACEYAKPAFLSRAFDAALKLASQPNPVFYTPPHGEER